MQDGNEFDQKEEKIKNLFPLSLRRKINQGDSCISPNEVTKTCGLQEKMNIEEKDKDTTIVT